MITKITILVAVKIEMSINSLVVCFGAPLLCFANIHYHKLNQVYCVDDIDQVFIH